MARQYGKHQVKKCMKGGIEMSDKELFDLIWKLVISIAVIILWGIQFIKI